MAKKILLADDSITIQKVISITFASENYELIIVGDGESAIKRAKEARPDLIMADVAMPGKNGYEVCEAIKNDPALSSIPVLLLAGTFEPLDRPEAERVGADDSIVKPFESQQLLNKVAELLAKAPERKSAPSEVRSAPPAPPYAEAGAAGFPEEEPWGDGDFIGFPEELQEKPAFKGADQLPDLDFLDNGGVFEEPEKELSEGEDFTDLDLNEAEDLGRPASFGAQAPSWQTDIVQEAAIEPEEPASVAAPVEEQAPQAPPRPFWAENVSREDNFVESKDISEFPDLYDEGAGPVEEEVASAPEVPAGHEHEEESFEKSFEGVESSFGSVPDEESAEVAVKEEEETPFRAPSFDRNESAAPEAAVAEQPSAYDEAIEAADTFEPEPPAYSPPVAERVEEAVTRKATDRLQSIQVPREELEEAVRKAVREVVQEIAWEVVPELAEELIRAEIDKVKEALTRLK